MEIIAVIAIVTVALLYTGRSLSRSFKNNDQACNGTCGKCYGCGGSRKSILGKKDNRNSAVSG